MLARWPPMASFFRRSVLAASQGAAGHRPRARSIVMHCCHGKQSMKSLSESKGNKATVLYWSDIFMSIFMANNPRKHGTSISLRLFVIFLVLLEGFPSCYMLQLFGCGFVLTKLGRLGHRKSWIRWCPVRVNGGSKRRISWRVLGVRWPGRFFFQGPGWWR